MPQEPHLSLSSMLTLLVCLIVEFLEPVAPKSVLLTWLQLLPESIDPCEFCLYQTIKITYLIYHYNNAARLDERKTLCTILHQKKNPRCLMLVLGQWHSIPNQSTGTKLPGAHLWGHTQILDEKAKLKLTLCSKGLLLSWAVSSKTIKASPIKRW